MTHILFFHTCTIIIFCNEYFSIAFITYATADEAAEVVKNSPLEINGETFNVEMARPKERNNQRGGRGGGRGA